MIIKSSFGALTKVLDEFTTFKISMLGSNFKDVLLEHIDADCLQ